MYGARPALPEHTEGELPAGDPLAAEFFAVPSAVVAPALIGKLVWVRGVGGGRLTEVEAYLPQDDPASHAARGPTRRNSAMFLPGGHVYLYRSYGVHICLNVVCDGEGVGSAVLIRSFEPVGDVAKLRHNRLPLRVPGGASPAPESDNKKTGGPWLSCGPGRVGQALGLRMELNGLPLGDQSGVFILDDGARPGLGCTTRVGVSRGASLPLRFYLAGSEYVSGHRRLSRGEAG
ncbi:MAG: DNA-3-methyladenine glycosylase [Actinobacteria bacterium]|nr:DNA-3-methyladenine glycosylase [Actinomycetota bacterium]